MDGIIFDVDGTIWDSTYVVAEAWNTVIKENSDLDIHITRADLMGLFGKTMDAIYHIMFPTLSDKEKKHLGQICIEYENKLLETKSGILYDGIEELFAVLTKKYPLYIVSNCQQGYIEVMLKTTGLGKYVTDHLCFGDTLKPKSDTIIQLMKRNNLKDVVYIGDTTGDFTACQEAGIPFIYAEYGFGDVPEAKVRIQKPLGLLDILPDFAG